MNYGTIKVTRIDGSIIDVALPPDQQGHMVATVDKGDETLYLYRSNHQWRERTKNSSQVYLSDGRDLYAEIVLQDGETGAITLEDQEIRIGSLAAPYEFLGYGELVAVTLQNGDQVQKTLQPQEYQNHYAYIALSDIDTRTAIYIDGQWRELTPKEYEQDERALEADMRDMARIDREWREYRQAGDELPPGKASL